MVASAVNAHHEQDGTARSAPLAVRPTEVGSGSNPEVSVESEAGGHGGRSGGDPAAVFAGLILGEQRP